VTLSEKSIPSILEQFLVEWVAKNIQTKMHILVFQHHPAEHPGSFRAFLTEDGHETTTVNLDQGDPVPDHFNFDALWVLGGPMDVWQEDDHPWLVAEKKYIREAVETHGLSYLGLCLGHQLLAEALGGSVGPGDPEIGVCDVHLTEAGSQGIFLDDLPDVFPSLQWHSAEVKTLPPGGECLATSDQCTYQALQWGPRAYSLQFHLEVENDTVSTWAEISEYREALEKALGPQGVDELNKACEKNLNDFQTMAERVYINWLQTAARTLTT